MQTLTDSISLNKLWCGLQTDVFHGESITADNSKIKRNFFKKGFVRLMSSCAFYLYLWLIKVSASDPFLKKLL